jgi:Arc/MetJ-type ribon-helix-helix transcriptional regulator
MVNGMATRKVTITLDEQELSRIKALVESDKARSVSGFVQDAVRVSLDDVSGWSTMLAEALGETGGDLTSDERAWADRILGTGKRRRHPAA